MGGSARGKRATLTSLGVHIYMMALESEATMFKEATRTNKQEVNGSTRVANNSLGTETKTNRAFVESGRRRARRTAGRVGRS